jgi:hypothetical protein
MAAVLGISESALRPRVSCLAASLKPTPTLAEVQSALTASLAGRLQQTPVLAEPSERELTLAGELLREEIGAQDYVARAEADIAVETAP